MLRLSPAIFVCPTYHLMSAVGAKAYKVSIILISSTSASPFDNNIQSEFAIPPALHGDDTRYYFDSGAAPPYANPIFDKAFAEAFLDFSISLNPNIKWDTTNIVTPTFVPWVGLHSEMVFNKTAAGAPDIRRSETDSGVLKRCE